MPSIPPGLKKILSIAIFAGIVFFGAKTCEVESAECELVFRLASPQSRGVVGFEIRLFEKGSSELIGQFKQTYHAGGSDAPARWPLKVAAGDYRVEGEIDIGAERLRFEQEVELTDHDVIVIHLDRYLDDVE